MRDHRRISATRLGPPRPSTGLGRSSAAISTLPAWTELDQALGNRESVASEGGSETSARGVVSEPAPAHVDRVRSTGASRNARIGWVCSWERSEPTRPRPSSDAASPAHGSCDALEAPAQRAAAGQEAGRQVGCVFIKVVSRRACCGGG